MRRMSRVSYAVKVDLIERYVAGGMPAVADDLRRHGLSPQYIRYQKHKHAPNRADHRRRIAPEQRHQLLQIYLHMGTKESRIACAESGVRSTYAETVAHDMGLYKHGNRS